MNAAAGGHESGSCESGSRLAGRGLIRSPPLLVPPCAVSMARQRTIVKRLDAVQNLGAMAILATGEPCLQ